MTDIKLDGSRVVVEGELDANSRMRVRQNVETAGIWFHQSGPNQDQAFVGMAADDAVGFFGSGVGWSFVMGSNTGNVGIGTGQQPPAGVKLDVGDRMRVRQAGEAAPTAGIWFHQSKPNQDRAFVGMAADDAVGFYGSTGADWGLVMNTSTGDVEVKQGAFTVRGATTLRLKGAGGLGGGEVIMPVGTSIVIEGDAIRVTTGQKTIDLVEEVRKLRAEVDALQGKGTPSDEGMLIGSPNLQVELDKLL